MKKSALTILFLTMFLVMLSLGVILPHLAYYAEELGGKCHTDRILDKYLFS